MSRALPSNSLAGTVITVVQLTVSTFAKTCLLWKLRMKDLRADYLDLGRGAFASSQFRNDCATIHASIDKLDARIRETLSKTESRTTRGPLRILTHVAMLARDKAVIWFLARRRDTYLRTMARQIEIVLPQPGILEREQRRLAETQERITALLTEILSQKQTLRMGTQEVLHRLIERLRGILKYIKLKPGTFQAPPPRPQEKPSSLEPSADAITASPRAFDPWVAHRGGADAQEYRYWAFISYSSKDKPWGRWLHRAIETYGIPAEFVEHRQTPTGHPAPKRFHPVFRDRDELPASADLGAVIKAALSASHYLIVICSPNSAHSHWVNTEIETFLALGRRDHILAIIVDGEPNTGDARECFPPALRQFEPIAADARRHADGKTNAKLKLLSGMLGVNFDSLKQRDKQRQKRRRTLIGVTAGVLATLIVTLTSIAVHQRRTATAMSGLAEQSKHTAEAEAKRATEAAQKATEEESKASRRLYAKSMLDIQSAWDRSDRSAVLGLLGALRPEHTGGVDLRGFEWYYWYRQCSNTLLTFKAYEEEFTSLGFSPDGKKFVSAGDDGLVKLWDSQTGKRLLTLKPRKSGVASVCFSPDGKQVAADGGNNVKIWDATSGKELFTLQGNSGGVTSICFSPDGKRIAVGSGGKRELVQDAGAKAPTLHSKTTRLSGSTVKLWDTEKGEEILTLVQIDKDEGAINCVSFSPDGTRLAWGGWQTLWEDEWKSLAEEEKKSSRPLGEREYYYAANGRFSSSDGKRRAGGGGEMVKVVDAATGKELVSCWGSVWSSIDSVCFSPDGKRLATGSEMEDVKVLDATTGTKLFTLEGISGSACFSPNGKYLVISDPDGFQNLNVLDATSGKALYPLTDGEIVSICFSPDGKRLAAGRAEGTVEVLKVREATETEDFSRNVGEGGGFIGPDGIWLAGKEKGDEGEQSLDGVEVWDAQSGQQRLSIKAAANASIGCFSPDGKRLATGGSGVTVKVWDTVTGQQLLNITDASDVSVVSFSPDGRRLATANRFSMKAKTVVGPDGEEVSHGVPSTLPRQPVRVWDAEGGRQILSVTGGGDFSFSPDSRRLATECSDDTVKVWDATNGQQLLSITGGGNDICFSPDGKRLAAGTNPLRGSDRDRCVKVWNADSGQQLLSIKGDCSPACFSPDGKRLAVDSGEGVKIWDAESGYELLKLERVSGELCFSPDGKRLAAGDGDNVKIWDAENGYELLELKGHPCGVKNVYFSPDGRRLISRDICGTVKIWDATNATPPASRRRTDAVGAANTPVSSKPAGRKRR